MAYKLNAPQASSTLNETERPETTLKQFLNILRMASAAATCTRVAASEAAAAVPWMAGLERFGVSALSGLGCRA